MFVKIWLFLSMENVLERAKFKIINGKISFQSTFTNPGGTLCQEFDFVGSYYVRVFNTVFKIKERKLFSKNYYLLTSFYITKTL